MVAIQCSLTRWRSVRFSGFFHSAYRARRRRQRGPGRHGGGSAVGPPVRAGVSAAAGGAPGFATHGIEGVGGPADDVKRVGAADGVGAALANNVGDPFGPVGGDMGDVGASPRPGGFQRIEEGAHGGAVPAGMGPDQAAAVVVDHDGQIFVAAFVGDYIDPDPCQAGERVDPGFGVGPHPGDDGSDCAPSDPHQLGDCLLGALGGQPGHLLVEGAGVSSAVSGPGDLSHRRAVGGAVDPCDLRQAKT